jgi:hypothetical protein
VPGFDLFRRAAGFRGGASGSILVNGKIVTADDRFTIAQALAISGNRIVAVGSNEQIRSRAGAPRVIDLKGATVIPDSSTTMLISCVSRKNGTGKCGSTASLPARKSSR